MSKQRMGHWFVVMALWCGGSAGCNPAADTTPPPVVPRPRQSQGLALSAAGALLAVVNPDVGTCAKGTFADQRVPAYDGTMRPSCAFDTPGLLGVADTPPHFHHGSAATLGDVVDHFVRFLAISPPPPAERADSIASLRSS